MSLFNSKNFSFTCITYIRTCHTAEQDSPSTDQDKPTTEPSTIGDNNSLTDHTNEERSTTTATLQRGQTLQVARVQPYSFSTCLRFCTMVCSKHVAMSFVQLLNLVNRSARRLTELFNQLNRRLKSTDRQGHRLGETEETDPHERLHLAQNNSGHNIHRTVVL